MKTGRKKGDHLLATWVNGKGWVRNANVPRSYTARPNYLIVCRYGDWSGFRTLAQCLETEVPEHQINGFYSIVERF